MLLDFRPHTRLQAPCSVDVRTAVAPVLDALGEYDADLGQVRVVCDWVQYRASFRDVVEVRPVLSRPGAAAGPQPEPAAVDGLEVAVDVRRSPEVALKQLTAARLCGADDGRIFLESWGRGSASCIWDFNTLYWSALELWEKASGRSYEQALPGGESDARNRDAARELISDLHAVWDRLAAANALPQELYVVELGVGNGSQARVFLDEFRDLDAVRGGRYYRRLHYLMCDYSRHVLDLAMEAVAGHPGHVSTVTLDATRPDLSLNFLRGKVFLFYVSNVYDNLPTDEVAQLGGRSYLVASRAYLARDGAAELAASVGVSPDRLPELVRKLLRLGPDLLPDVLPDHFPDVDAAVGFWQRTWSLLRLAERYEPLDGLDQYALAPSITGEALRPLLESGGDIRMHVSNGAVASLVSGLQLLHPFGKLVCHDLFVTGPQEYRTGFRGPGKYDGSVVNWVNGPLLAQIGRRLGYDVEYAPFRHRKGNIVTLTAQVAD
jgi:hypothetical protein